jgi:hypothetical protein
VEPNLFITFVFKSNKLNLNQIKKSILLAIASIAMLSSCDNNNGYRNGHVSVNSQPQIVVTPVATNLGDNLGDNLDLQALGELVKTSSNAEDMEAKLNASGSINNLDLDGDGNVDYIKVTEYGDGNARGFSFTVDLANGEKQEIAMQLIKDAEDSLNTPEEETETITTTTTTEEVEEYVDVVELPYYGYDYYDPYYDPYYISPIWIVPIILLY